jgi:hypothetical protein
VDSAELGRLLAAKRAIVKGNCMVCGREFEGIKKRKYCSHTCAQRVYDAKKRAMRDHADSNEVRGV